MAICFQDAAEIIPRMNSHLNDHDVTSIVGLEVVVKNLSDNKLVSYISNIVHLSKKSVDDDHLEAIGKKNITRYHMNKIMKEFEEKTKHNKLVEVIERDGYTNKLINVDSIVEVKSFAADPEDGCYKKHGLSIIASAICS